MGYLWYLFYSYLVHGLLETTFLYEEYAWKYWWNHKPPWNHLKPHFWEHAVSLLMVQTATNSPVSHDRVSITQVYNPSNTYWFFTVTTQKTPTREATKTQTTTTTVLRSHLNHTICRTFNKSVSYESISTALKHIWIRSRTYTRLDARMSAGTFF